VVNVPDLSAAVVNVPAAGVVPPMAGGEARYVLKPAPLTVDDADSVVNAPVFAVVAPTVPLMLMLAVPVRFVTVPLDGVPNAPPLVTNAPTLPTAMPRAVITPVPVVVVDGATPAPPPITRALDANAAEVAHVEADEKYGIPPDVPATVKAGVVVAVATDTIPPVKLALVTVPVAGATQDIAPAVVAVSIYPLVVGAAEGSVYVVTTALALPCNVVVVEFDDMDTDGLVTLDVNVGAVELKEVAHAVPVDTAMPALG